MPKALTVSIVIPAYNEESHLKACLEAIAAQTDKPDEVIVVDNNSTDGSVKVARTFPFVTLIREKRQGVVFARNCGFDTAASEIIGRIDADTLLPPGWVARVRRLFRDDSIAAATGPVRYYDMPLPNTNYWIDHQIRKRLYRGAPHIPFLFGTNMAIRKDAWQDVKSLVCVSRDYHEDLDLAIHLAHEGFFIKYDKGMLAGMSARRYDDLPQHFHNYMNVYLNTYRVHGFRSIVPRIATLFYWFGYFTLKPFRRAFDQHTGKMSLAQFQKGHKPRKSPTGK